MTLSDAFTVYPWGALALLGWLAAIDRHTASDAFLLSMLWPISLVLIAWHVALDAMQSLGFQWAIGPTCAGVGWRIERAKDGYIGFCVLTPHWGFCFGWKRP